MPVQIVPEDSNGAEIYLLKLYFETENKLIQEIIRKRNAGYVDYAEVSALERVRKTLDNMLKQSRKYVPMAIVREFSRMGYKNARDIVNPRATKAIEILTENLMGRLEEAAEVAYKDTAVKLFAIGRLNEDIFREQALTKAVESQVAGTNALTQTNAFVEELHRSGIVAFEDKAGRQWGLSAYGDMSVRTTVRQAQTAAVLTKDEHDLYIISKIGTTCPVCAVYEGRVYSKSGTSPYYPPLAMAFGKIDPSGSDDLMNTFLNIHPNCLHSIVPWSEEGKTDKQIEDMRRYSNPETNPLTHDPRTKKQREAYMAKERERARYREAVAMYRRYEEAGVKMPSFKTFLKHRNANDDKYKEWIKAYRSREK